MSVVRVLEMLHAGHSLGIMHSMCVFGFKFRLCFYTCFIIIPSVLIDVCFVSSNIYVIFLSECSVYFLNNLLILLDTICAVLSLLCSTEGGVMT
jgi:hypothetical protein